MFSIFKRNKNRINLAEYELVNPEPIKPVEEAWIALRSEIDTHNKRVTDKFAQQEAEHRAKIQHNERAWALVVAYAIKRGIETKKLGASIIMHSEGPCPNNVMFDLEKKGYTKEYQHSSLRLVIRWTPDTDDSEISNPLGNDELFHIDGFEDYKNMTGHTAIDTTDGTSIMKRKSKLS